MWGEITGETIKSAIAEKLRDSFLTSNPNIKIYKEKIVQKVSTPCFFIWTMDVEQEKLMLNNYNRSYQMNVRYHIDNPSVNNVYEQLCAMGNTLLEVLERINVPIVTDSASEETRPVIGKQMSFEINEGVLQLYVTYTIKAKAPLPDVPDMYVLDINNN